MSTLAGRSIGPAHAKPRRSRGCNTCRQRKVKCDERLPTCQRCDDSGRICLGYTTPLVFVNMVTGEPNTVGNYNDKGKKALSAPERSDSSSTGPSTIEGPAISPNFHLGAYRDQIVMSHLMSQLAIRLDNGHSPGVDAPTISTILTNSNSKSIAYMAGLSCAEALFGRVYKLSDMVDHSVQLYDQTLRGLRKDLQFFSREMSHSRAYDNLWSTVLLGMYELVSPAGPSKWLEHSRGLSALTELLGPYAFQSPAAHELLITFRTNMAIGCLLDKKRCFLEGLEWKTIPWATRTQDRTIGDFLRDIFCNLPGLLEKAERGFADQALQQEISGTIQKLEQLRWRWGIVYSKACWERPLNPHTSLSLDAKGQPLFSTVLDFEEAERAVEILYFNATRLMLYTISDQVGLREPLPLDQSTLRFHGPRLNADILPGQGSRKMHALEICRIVDYFMEDKRASRGAMILFFPLSVARTHLEHDPRMSAWVARILGAAASSKGWNFGETD